MHIHWPASITHASAHTAILCACVYIDLHQPYLSMHLYFAYAYTWTHSLALKQSITARAHTVSRRTCVNRKHRSKGTHAHQWVSKHACVNRKHHSKGTHAHQCVSKHACVNRKHRSKGTHAHQCVSIRTCMHKSTTATANKQVCMFSKCSCAYKICSKSLHSHQCSSACIKNITNRANVLCVREFVCITRKHMHTKAL